jgi:hypothetical protein
MKDHPDVSLYIKVEYCTFRILCYSPYPDLT